MPPVSRHTACKCGARGKESVAMNRSENIVILGLGRTARAAAAYLMQQGCSVTLWGRSSDIVKELSDKGIHVTGACPGHYTPRVYTSLADAVRGAGLILVMTVAAGHAPVARRLQGLLEQRQRILIFNGNWGAYEFFRELEREAEEKQVVIAETGAQLFLSDYAGGGCHIKSIKKEITLATVHPEQAQELCRELHSVFPQFVPGENVISTSLNSSNPVMHAPIALFNITRMENGENYSFYADAATHLTLGAVEKIDAERCAVTEAAGAVPVCCVDIINSFWPDKYDTLYDAVKNNEAYLSGKGPKTVRHRYLEEDLPFGIAPIALLGRIYGIETPCIDALLGCYRWLMGVDYLTQAPQFDPGLLNRLTSGFHISKS